MLHTEPSIERPWPTSQEIININSKTRGIYNINSKTRGIYNINSKTRGIYNVHEYNVKQETIHYELA
jgi:hypothetical protein